MILSADEMMMIDGLSTDITPLYKDDEGKLRNAEFYVMNGAGVAIKPRAIYVYDNISCCTLTYLSLYPSVSYTVSGICNPGGRTVYLSSAPNQISGQSLKDNVLAQAEADSNGEYMFSGLTNIDGACVLWANMPPDYLRSSSITYSVESLAGTTDELLVAKNYIGTSDGYCICPTCGGERILKAGESCKTCGGDGVMNNTAVCTECNSSDTTSDGSICSTCGGDGYIDIPCDTCNGTGTIPDTTQCPKCTGTGRVYDDYFAEPSCSISGTCPNDAETVYISEYIESDSTDYETGAGLTAAVLAETIVTSVSTENGTYTIEFRSVANTRYVLWCTSPSAGELSIDDVLMKETQAACLSGDTRISITCDHTKRLDELRVGDMVMSENGASTKVLEIRRGFFNYYHTLYIFEDGTVIDETHDHRFYNYDQGFWQVLKNWNIGDRAVKQNGEKVALVSVERVNEEAELFGLWTESGSYYANGLLSGVASCNKSLLKDATAEKAIDMLLSVKELQLLQLMGLDGVLP